MKKMQEVGSDETLNSADLGLIKNSGQHSGKSFGEHSKSDEN